MSDDNRIELLKAAFARITGLLEQNEEPETVELKISNVIKVDFRGETK